MDLYMQGCFSACQKGPINGSPPGSNFRGLQQNECTCSVVTQKKLKERWNIVM